MAPSSLITLVTDLRTWRTRSLVRRCCKGKLAAPRKAAP